LHDNCTEVKPHEVHKERSKDEFQKIKYGNTTIFCNSSIIEVIRLAEQAKSEGWSGDWDKRIEKAKKKLGNGGLTTCLSDKILKI